MNSNPNAGSMLRRKNRITAIVLALLESSLTGLSFVVAYVVRRALPFSKEIYPFSEYRELLVTILILWVIVAILLDAYRIVERQENIVSVRNTAEQVAIAGALVLVFIAVFKLDVSRSLIAIFLTVNFLGLSIFRISSKRLRRAVRQRFGGYQFFLVVGTSDEALSIARTIQDHEVLGAKLFAIVRLGNE